MATKQSTIDYLLDQLHDARTSIRTRKMFGEYALYFNEKVVAFICDDQLFVKRTEEGKQFIGNVVEAPPYPSAKLYYLISQDYWEDASWVLELLTITASVLPLPKQKTKKRNNE